MKKLKNSIPLLLILVLISVTTISVSPVAAQAQTILYVWPDIVEGYDPGTTFDIYIMVENVWDLYGFEFKLKYNKDVLLATGISLGAPSLGTSFFPIDVDPPCWIAHEEINNDVGYVWYAVSLPSASTEGVGGSGILATISFTVNGSGATVLDLDETILGNSPPAGGENIDHEVRDGYFTNVGIAPIASLTVSDTTPERHEVVTFDGSRSFSYLYPIVSYSWDFGDGYTATGVIVTHVYYILGTFTAKLTITNEAGYSDSASVTINVVMATVNLFGWMAKPEHWNYSISKDENSGEEPAVFKFQTLFGKVKNYVRDTKIAAKVVFDVYDQWGTPWRLSLKTPEITLEPYGDKGDWAVLTFDLYPPPPGTYYVVARASYWDPTVNNWVAGVKIKTFDFVVIP